MKNVRNVLISTMVMLSLLVVGCSDDDNDYVGSNKVLLQADGTSELTVGEENQEVNVKVTFTKTAEKDTPLTLVFENKTDATNNDILVVDGTPTLKMDEREVSFKVTLKEGTSVFKNNTIELTLKFTDTQYAAVLPINITVKPAIKLKDLTAEQMELLAGYKANGMDISPFIGKVNVIATALSHAGGSSKFFENEWTKEYKGVTVITLSKYATTEKPVLKMVSNAMGSNELFNTIMYNETVNNDEYWYGEYAGPNYKLVMDAIAWNKDSEETFTTALDSIVIEPQTDGKSNVKYIKYTNDEWGDPFNVVPFEFGYTAYDRAIEKSKENADLKTIVDDDQDGTPRPGHYINTTTIEDGWDYSREVTGEINFNENTMKFSFVFQHYLAGDYVWVDAVYTK